MHLPEDYYSSIRQGRRLPRYYLGSDSWTGKCKTGSGGKWERKWDGEREGGRRRKGGKNKRRQEGAKGVRKWERDRQRAPPPQWQRESTVVPGPHGHLLI